MQNKKMNIVNSVVELVGNTPVIKLNRVVGESDINLYAKLESFNPGGSIKDRIALNMILDLEERQLIEKGDTIIEPTSGNTGVGIAMISAVKGYNAVIIMPENMSIERIRLMKAYGAQVILTDKQFGMKGAITEAEKLAKENKGWHILQQFENGANPEAHVKNTAEELIKQMDGKIDAIVIAVGTGGTITGIAQRMKAYNANIEIVAVEPENSAVLSGEQPGPHKIQGIGAGFIPKILKTECIDEIIRVKDEDAFSMSRKLAKEEGLLVGISSGAAVFAAIEKGKNMAPGKNIVTILPDTGERYLSTELFCDL